MFRAAVMKNIRPMVAARPQQLAIRHASSKSAWFRDPATYPLLGILGSAVALCSSFIVYFSATSPDVRVSKDKRQNLLRA